MTEPIELIEEALSVYLTGNAGVAAKIGSRLYPLTIPVDSALPAAAYLVITTIGDETHDGPSGMVEKSIQITIDADTYKAAKFTAKALRQALDGHTADMSGIKIFCVTWTNEYDGYAQQQNRATVRQDYIVKYQEP